MYVCTVFIIGLCTESFVCMQGTWDLREYGPVYALTVGPYGTVFALSWNRDAPGQPTTVTWLDTQQGEPHCCCELHLGVRLCNGQLSLVDCMTRVCHTQA